MTEFTQWLNDFLARFSKELQEGASGQMQKLLAGMVTPEMIQNLLKGIDLSAMAQMLGGERIQVPGQGDPYKILGLDRSCSDEEVKARWRLLASKLHPDKSGTPATGALFHLVREAYHQVCQERGMT